MTIDEIRNASLRRARVALPRTRISRRTRQNDFLRQQSSRNAASSRSSLPRASSSSSSAASQGSSAPSAYDPRMDTAVRSDILLLGEVTPILAGVSAFSNQEPIDVTEIEVDMSTSATSLSQMLVYDETGRFLGNATKSGGNFVARLPDNFLQLPYRKEMSFYVRGRLKTKDSGGISGEDVLVNSITIRGNGAWSSEERATTSTETFVSFQTARARIAKIENVGGTDAILVGGNNQLLGSFKFSATESDSAAEARLTDLHFTVESYGGVTLANPVLRVQGVPEAFTCTLASSVINCDSLPDEYGTIDMTPLTLRVYADVTVPTSNNDMFVRLTLNDPGTTSSDGAIEWTDGASNFGWVPFDAPVARGTSNTR
jgi:hypothetical protein